jgi:hypothetical protein
MMLLLEIIQQGSPDIQLSLRDFFVVIGAVLAVGKTWQKIRDHEKQVTDLKTNLTEELKGFKQEIKDSIKTVETRAERMEDQNLRVIEKISEKLEDMGERFLQFGQELKSVLSDHHVRLSLLESMQENDAHKDDI